MGNAEDAAMTFTEALGGIGVDVEAMELNQIDVTDLQSATHFIAVTSTFGDGEFPDNATLFWEALSAENADRLEHLGFAVLARGDISYDLFCNAGILLDQRLEALGATRLAERVDIDGFYEQPAKAWTTDVVKLLQADMAGSAAVTVSRAAPAAEPVEATGPDRTHPFEAKLTVNRLLTGSASGKEVRHYEIDLNGSGIAYQAGDSIAVHAANDPALVNAILARLGVGPDHAVTDHEEPLGVLLAEHREIRTPSRALQALVATRTDYAQAAAALASDAVPGSWSYGKDVLDLIGMADLTVDDVIDTLRPLQFRATRSLRAHGCLPTACI